MINPFDRFYDVRLNVFQKGADSYSEKGKMTYMGSVMCDVQPLSEKTEQKMPSLEHGREYKLYCDNNDLIRTGRYISFGGSMYLITGDEHRSLGMTAVMRSVENEYQH